MATILIVGGAMGSGGALARSLSGSADVVLVDPQAAAFARRSEPGNARISALDAEFSRADLGEAALSFCHECAGPPDGLFVGIHRATPAPLGDWTASMFDAEIGANLTAPFLVARAVGLDMMARRRGAIVLTSSTAGLTGSAGKAPFHAAKAALTGLCRALADEFGPFGIRVNALLPGWIDSPFGRDGKDATPFVPLGRWGATDEVAASAAFLLAQPYASGAELVVDGGYSAVAH